MKDKYRKTLGRFALILLFIYSVTVTFLYMREIGQYTEHNNNISMLFKEREAALNDFTILKEFNSFMPTYSRELDDGYDNEYHIYNVNGLLTASDANNDKQFSENHDLIARIFDSYTNGHY